LVITSMLAIASDVDVWPDPDWAVAIAPPGPAVEAFEEYAFTLVGANEDRKGRRTDGVVIVHEGTIVYEKYARGWGPDNPHLTWSVSKSFTNALVGMSVYRGYLSLDDSVCDHYDRAPDSACDITVFDLLHMGSGLDWNEGYEDEPYYLSSVIAMLYGVGSGNMASFVARHDRYADPGTYYAYSTGDSVLLAATMQGALPSDEEPDFPRTALFDPIGMDSAIFERDRSGTLVGGSYVYATPRDMARFGYFFLNDGCWNGERLLPEGWVAMSTAVNPVFLQDRHQAWYRDEDPVPGAHWWTNNAVPDLAFESAWPDVPADAYQAAGHWGQSITVIPSLDVVIVRTADDRESHVLDKNRFLSLALAVVEEGA